MSQQAQDYQQRMADAQWAIAQCLQHGVCSEAVSILAYECGFNSTDVKQIISSIQETA